MDKDVHAENFGLPEAFVSAFASAHGSDARMKVVELFFERAELALGTDGTLALEPNEPHQFYLVGSTSLIHIERHEPTGTFHVVQPVQRKRGTIGKGVLEDKIVSQMKTGRKLWLLIRNVPSSSRRVEPPRQSTPEAGRLAQADDSCASAAAIHPDDIVPATSSPRLAAVEGGGRGGELDLGAFGQLRTMLQNVRLQFWNGDVRSQATETLSVALQKAEEHDITGAIQAIEMLENVFVRLIEQWEHDFREAERRVKRGRGDAGEAAKFKTHLAHHAEMQSRITHTKTKFRIMLNGLRELETKMKHGDPGDHMD